MDNNWFEDMYESFVNQSGGDAELHHENVANMLLYIEYWCETKGLRFEELLQRAKALKQMYDGADNLVREGFEPHQVVIILQNRFGG